MILKKTDDPMLFQDDSPAKITKMGNITDLVVCDTINFEPVCKKISKDLYLNTKTGEVNEYKHITDRSKSYDSIRKTMARIRSLINTNVTNNNFLRWITLTYRENMKDTKRLYLDFDKFWKRFKYYCAKRNLKIPEYITVIEPQGRGAWHIHGLLIWSTKAPYIPNDDLAKLWTHGYVNIKQPKECDNLGAYLTAYLTNMEYDEITQLSDEDKVKAYVAASCVGDTTEFVNVNSKKIGVLPFS